MYTLVLNIFFTLYFNPLSCWTFWCICILGGTRSSSVEYFEKILWRWELFVAYNSFSIDIFLIVILISCSAFAFSVSSTIILSIALVIYYFILLSKHFSICFLDQDFSVNFYFLTILGMLSFLSQYLVPIVNLFIIYSLPSVNSDANNKLPVCVYFWGLGCKDSYDCMKFLKF